MINIPATKNTPLSITGYHKLLIDIRKELQEGLKEITRLIEREKVLRYWMIGRCIHEYLQNQVTGNGKIWQFYNRLEKDLELSARTLKLYEQFYRYFPNLKPDGKLQWSHYRYLLTVSDLKERKHWIKRIYQENMSTQALRTELSPSFALSGEERGLYVLTEPQRGILYTYGLVRDESSWLVDCGFANRIEAPACAAQLHNKRIYTSMKFENSYRLQVAARVKVDELYTFKAKLIRVIDGDTLLVLIDQGFGIRTEQRLRLRGIDAPEMSTVPGRKAKIWMEKELTGLEFIIVKTHKSDKYDRYLVDVFILPNETDPQQVASHGLWLNGKMIKAGMAVPWKHFV